MADRPGPYAVPPHPSAGRIFTDGSEYTADQVEFMLAMDRYKRTNRRPFPTWSEVLEVLYALGYRKVAEPTSCPVRHRHRH